MSAKALIVTADDFGMAREVNEAVEIAHQSGILTATSLMIGSRGAEDAVARAKTMPTLGVGLHVVLVEGRPVLSRSAIPSLVDGAGNFRDDMVQMSFELAFLPGLRSQIAAEIEAQFKAFAATGLPLDHVNAHCHFHLHPMIGELILEIGKRYGMKAMRVPYEPLEVLRKVEPRTGGGTIVRLAGYNLARRAAAEGIWAPDAMFGNAWSGSMSTKRLAGLLDNLPAGVSEIYLHPATGSYPGSTPGYHYAEELAALVAPEVVEGAKKADMRLGRFADFMPHASAV